MTKQTTNAQQRWLSQAKLAERLKTHVSPVLEALNISEDVLSTLILDPKISADTFPSHSLGHSALDPLWTYLFMYQSFDKTTMAREKRELKKMKVRIDNAMETLQSLHNPETHDALTKMTGSIWSEVFSELRQRNVPTPPRAELELKVDADNFKNGIPARFSPRQIIGRSVLEELIFGLKLVSDSITNLTPASTRGPAEKSIQKWIAVELAYSMRDSCRIDYLTKGRPTKYVTLLVAILKATREIFDTEDGVEIAEHLAREALKMMESNKTVRPTPGGKGRFFAPEERPRRGRRLSR